MEIGAAILPIYTRTPTLIAMTAAGIDALSDGRFHLGLGASGPQVIEGFHGVPYTQSPRAHPRDRRDLPRGVAARGTAGARGRATSPCRLPADQGTGLGKPLKIIAHPVRSEIPIWIASLGEKNVAMTAEIADGWLPILFIPERAQGVWGAALSAGAGEARAPALGELMISAGGLLAIGEGERRDGAARAAAPVVALYVGGMGAKGKNFYNELAVRYGFEKEADAIQDLYLAGKKKRGRSGRARVSSSS